MQTKRKIGHHSNETARQVLARSVRFLGKAGEYCQALGFRLGVRWYAARALARLPIPGLELVHMKPRELLYPVGVRMKGSSDEFVFDEIFIRREYGAVCEHLKKPQVIVDLGANVGYASAYLASRYPEARVIAVEPDPENFTLCRRNLELYGIRVMTLHGAVWSSCSKLALSYELGDGWATQVVAERNEGAAEIEAWDVTTLLDMCHAETVDLLKVDIEGSEVEAFGANSGAWLPRVRNICIELHDARCRDTFFKALDGFEYELVESGESTMCLNMRARSLKGSLKRNSTAGGGAPVSASA